MVTAVIGVVVVLAAVEEQRGVVTHEATSESTIAAAKHRAIPVSPGETKVCAILIGAAVIGPFDSPIVVVVETIHVSVLQYHA